VTVLDSASGMPLADATVFIEGTTETARTDDAGRAVLHAASRDPTVVVRRIGFAQLMLRLTLGTGLRQQLPVTLSRVHALAAVEVIGRAPLLQSIERRRSLSRGWVYGPEELAATHHVKTLIGRTPGAAVDGTARWRVRFRHPNLGGDCWADVYIDGVLEAPHVGSFDGRGGNTFLKFEGLDSYPPSAIYAIEVYPRASQAPQDIVQLRDGCGAILVWTQSYAERELAREEGRNRARPDSGVP